MENFYHLWNPAKLIAFHVNKAFLERYFLVAYQIPSNNALITLPYHFNCRQNYVTPGFKILDTKTEVETKVLEHGKFCRLSRYVAASLQLRDYSDWY